MLCHIPYKCNYDTQRTSLMRRAGYNCPNLAQERWNRWGPLTEDHGSWLSCQANCGWSEVEPAVAGGRGFCASRCLRQQRSLLIMPNKMSKKTGIKACAGEEESRETEETKRT